MGIIALFICTGITPSVAVNTIEQCSMPVSNGNTLYVGGSGEGNYSNIQDAINDSNDGDTVFVFSGIYYENVLIKDKSIMLIGEDTNSTIIDEGGDITPGSYTLWLSGADGSTVCNLTLQNSTTISGHNFAFLTWRSDNIKILNCRIRDSLQGMELMYSEYVYMRNNCFENNTFNFGILRGSTYQDPDFYNDIDTSNTINGKTIYNINNQSNLIIDSVDIGWLGLNNCTNITVKNITITDNFQNILISNTKYSTISNCKLYNARDKGITIDTDSNYNKIENCPILEGVGIYSYEEIGSEYTTITNCNLTNRIVFWYSNNNYVDNCNIDGCSIWIYDAKYNTIINCNISNYSHGILFNGCILGAHYNQIINNSFYNISHIAIHLNQDCDYNKIIGNHFNNANSDEKDACIYIEGPDDCGSNDNNFIYHNTFINNTRNAYDGCNNSWDNGYPSGGNFWDDYNGTDEDGDGIGDIPYPIPGAINADRYPLMEPWNHPPDTPTIDGPTSGKVGVEYEYNFSLSDPNEDRMRLRVDWGSGTPSKWYGPYDSGTIVKLNHSWRKKGTYSIRAQTQDSIGLLSNWGTLEVTMPKNRAKINSLFLLVLDSYPFLEVFLRAMNQLR